MKLCRGGGGTWPTPARLPAPRIIDGDDLAITPALDDVEEERQHRQTQNCGAGGGEMMFSVGEAVGGQIVGVSPRHPFVTGASAAPRRWC